MNDDLRELLALLIEHQVEFVVIGAHALAAYTRPRMTEDLDLLVGRSEENVKRLAAALAAFGVPIGEEGMRRFASQDRQMIRIGAPPNMVDILNFAGNQPFEVVWASRVAGELDGIPISVPSREHLIDMKRAAGRPQDLVDIANLEAAPEDA
jgi:hypothetical protein